MSRPALLFLAFALLAAVAAAQESEAGPPNILFLFADDQRADTIAAWGNEHISTPALDRLANTGYSFRANYCMGSNHGAVCVPSRAMLMTGQAYHRHLNDLRGLPLLPALLAERGYATFGTGKWHNGGASFERAFQRGRNVFLGGMCDHTEVKVHDLSPAGKLEGRGTAEGFSSELFADALVEFLGEHDGVRPFFAYCAFTAPHDPRQPPERWRERYYEDPPPLPRNFLPQHPFQNGALVLRDEVLAAWPRERSVVRDQLCEYYGLISHLDEQVGRILDTLEKSPFAKNTVIVYAADHGLAVGSHGLLGKQSLYEHSMRCPLIITGPGIPKGETRALTYVHDLFPTLTRMAGARDVPENDGRDLGPILRGEAASVRDSIFLSYARTQRAVRRGRWKLIRYPAIDHVQLFDLEADPHELEDLAPLPEHAARIADLTVLMKRWKSDVADPHPLSVLTPKEKEVDLTGRTRKPDRWQPEWIRKKYFD